MSEHERDRVGRLGIDEEFAFAPFPLAKERPDIVVLPPFDFVDTKVVLRIICELRRIDKQNDPLEGNE